MASSASFWLLYCDGTKKASNGLCDFQIFQSLISLWIVTALPVTKVNNFIAN